MIMMPSGPCPARIMLVGDAPSEMDLLRNMPFAGHGNLLAELLRDAGLSRSECFCTYVVKEKLPGNDIGSVVADKKKDITKNHTLVNGKFVLPQVVSSLEVLRQEIEMCQPNVIVALGNLALWALTGNWGVSSWRGSVLEGFEGKKVIPTLPMAFVMAQWHWRGTVVHDFRKVKREALCPGIIRPDYQFIIRPDYSTACSVLFQLYQQLEQRKGKLAIDIETRAGHIACISVAWSPTEAICIPLMDSLHPEGYWPLQQEAEIVHALYKVLTHKNCEGIGQNFHYDAQYFYRWLHFTPRIKRDTMTAQHTMFSTQPKSLDYLSSLYCQHHVYWKDDGKEWHHGVSEDTLWNYCCMDSVKTFEVDTGQQIVIDNLGLREVHDFQQKLFYPVLNTMIKGIRIDHGRKSAVIEELHKAIAERQEKLRTIIGYDLNIKSPKQMQGFFYEELRQKVRKSRKTGNESCDDEALQKIAAAEPLLRPVVRLISELRSLHVFLGTFAEASLDTDGRMRCFFKVAGTATYRFASAQNAFGSGMNLQNIPAGSEDSSDLALPNIRKMFIPDEGMMMFDIDLSSADLRIVVWEADETEMKAMLQEGLDPYTEIAKEYYHDSSITKSDPRRQKFKSFAHGTNYLGTAKGLAERLGLSVAEADKTQRWYFSRFPRIKKWQENLKHQVLTRKMVQNVFGYRCYFFDRIEGTIFNEAAAWIPQSTVACLINRAYVNITENLSNIDILLQVHDSLTGQFPIHLKDEIVPKILQQSSITLPYAGDPLVIPVGIKLSEKSWGDCK